MAIYQGDITITDTGKRRVSDSSASETDRVNSGTGITLQGVEVTFQLGAMTNTNSVPNKFVSNDQNKRWTHGEVDQVGLNIPKWTIRGILDLSDSSDETKYAQIADLVRTKGYKTISGHTMITKYSSLKGDVSTINVRVTNFTAKNSTANPNIVNYTIECLQDVED